LLTPAFPGIASRKKPAASAPGLAISEAQFAELIDTCGHLDSFEPAAVRLISLTTPI
jgi:hypothetical protein